MPDATRREPRRPSGTAGPDVLASVVMPELVFSGWLKLLHNQRVLYIKHRHRD